MDIGMIGLGRMGANMAERLQRGGHRVVGFDTNFNTPTGDKQRSIGVALSQPRPWRRWSDSCSHRAPFG